MRKETRTVVYDEELRIEAYRFEGTRQPFPNYFHEYYVIGFVESGERYLSKNVMLDLAQEVTGKRELPGFFENVILDEDVTCYLQPLHEMVMWGANEFGKEENLILLLSMLMQRYGQPFEDCIPECRNEIEKAC